jgi:hypothetical protein
LLNVDTLNSNVTILGNNTGEVQPWKTTVNDSVVHASHQTAIVNGYFYILDSGLGSTKAKVNADGSLGTFSSITSEPYARDSYGVATYNGYIYLLGGSTNGTKVTYAKPSSDGSITSWTDATVLPAARSYGVSFAANGYLYFLGGTNGTNGQTNDYYAKINPDGSIGSWNTTTVLPTGNNQMGVAVANGYVYLAGGSLAGTGVTRNVYYARLNIDGTVGSWTTVTNALPSERTQPGTAIVNGYLYVVGGTDSTPTSQASVFYAQLNSDGSLGSFNTAANSLPANRNTFGIIPSANGYMYVAGGNLTLASPQSTIYYTSTSRLLVGGGLDLVGLSGENLNEGGSGGSLTAGNTQIVGSLDVQGSARFSQNVSIDRTLVVSSDTLVKTATNTTTAFQVQNSGGAQLLNVDTTNPVSDLTTNSTANLVTNGSMEGANGVTGWTARGSAATPTQVSTQKYIGNNALSETNNSCCQ